MSNGNRGFLAALAGIAALLVATGTGAFYGSLYSPAKKQYAAVDANQTSNNTYQGVTKSLPDIALVPDPVERAMANPPPKSGQDHEKRDLAAQESMAAWAFYMVLFAGATALITGFGTYFIAVQVGLTRKAVEGTSDATGEMRIANQIAAKAIVIGSRPLFLVESVYVGQDRAGRWEYAFNLKNAGKGPAYILKFEQRRICRLYEDTGDGPNATRELLDETEPTGVRVISPGGEHRTPPRMLHVSDSVEGIVTVGLVMHYQSAFTDGDGERGGIFITEAEAEIRPITAQGTLLQGRIRLQEVLGLTCVQVISAKRLT